MTGLDTSTSPLRGSRSGSTRRARNGDFHVATTGDLHLATSGDFLMAMDIDRASYRAIVCQGWFPQHGTQLCPLCLSHDGIWQLSWKLPVSTVCPDHGVYLAGLHSLQQKTVVFVLQGISTGVLGVLFTGGCLLHANLGA